MGRRRSTWPSRSSAMRSISTTKGKTPVSVGHGARASLGSVERVSRKAPGLPFLLLPLAFPTAGSLERDARAPCPSLDANECARVRALVAASPAFDDLIREY